MKIKLALSRFSAAQRTTVPGSTVFTAYFSALPASPHQGVVFIAELKQEICGMGYLRTFSQF